MSMDNKVTRSHLERAAYVYVRQSSLQQLSHNRESTARQYDLKTRAVELGWRPDQVVVIDEDLGESGSSALRRRGFQRLVADVGLGKVGVVLGLEVSRLARNCSDWHRLLEICGLRETLIVDEEGIYDPNNINDRLLLGLKGSMSEAELFMLRARLEGGKLNKARRGELALQLPVGLVYDGEGRVRLDPDRQVLETLRHVFESFRRIGSAVGVVKHLRRREIRLPVRIPTGPSKGELGWVDATTTRVLHMLRNPRYAGAFVYGRTRKKKGLSAVKRLSESEWKVFLPDAHPGLISWTEFQANQAKLLENSLKVRGRRLRLPPREGPALLQGLVICGLCGRRMTLRYHLRRGVMEPDYVCQKVSTEQGGRVCHSVPGACSDKAVGKLVVEAVTPTCLETALEVFDEIRRRDDEVELLHQARVERASEEAERARQQFLRVNPENRLVAECLEREWNEKLEALKSARQGLEAWRAQRPDAVNPETRESILRLAKDLPALWSDPRVEARERKRLLRLFIEDVTLVKDSAIQLQVRWRGGALTETTIPLPPNAVEARRTPKALLNRIAEDARCFPDSAVAERLNEAGEVSGTGRPFTASIVTRLRRSYGIPGYRDHLLQAGWLSAREAREKLGISKSLLSNWRRRSVLESKRCGDGTWVFRFPSDNPPRPQKGVKLAKRGFPARELYQGANEV